MWMRDRVLHQRPRVDPLRVAVVSTTRLRSDFGHAALASILVPRFRRRLRKRRRLFCFSLDLTVGARPARRPCVRADIVRCSSRFADRSRQSGANRFFDIFDMRAAARRAASVDPR